MQTADCRLGIKCRPTGLKKKEVLSGHLGQVDFPSGQVAFHSHLPMGKGSGKLFVN